MLKGIWKPKVVPTPAFVLTIREPWCDSTIRCTMASHNPVLRPTTKNRRNEEKVWQTWVCEGGLVESKKATSNKAGGVMWNMCLVGALLKYVWWNDDDYEDVWWNDDDYEDRRSGVHNNVANSSLLVFTFVSLLVLFGTNARVWVEQPLQLLGTHATSEIRDGQGCVTYTTTKYKNDDDNNNNNNKIQKRRQQQQQQQTRWWDFVAVAKVSEFMDKTFGDAMRPSVHSR